MQKPSLKEARIRTKNKVKVINYGIDDNLKKLGKDKKYFIKTYGCQMNEHDTENIRAILEDIGYTAVNEMEQADLIILNTCAIRENAHNKVFGMVGRIKHLKATKPNILVGICGCMAQEETIVDEILDKYRWIDIVFGTHNIHRLPYILYETINNKKQEIEVYSVEGEIIENIPVKRDNKYTAYVNIMYGCDKFCTYCIVPFTRGKQRSRDHHDIIDEIEDLIRNGYMEVTLLGQNVNAYGKDLNNDYGMAELLRDVANTGIKRIRFITSHPWDFTDEMIDVISEHSNIMPYIHLPIQSGSNKILRLMGRKYSKDDYLKLFEKIKLKIPNVAITTDIIVGFPRETETDFQETLDVVNKCQFDSAFTFIFSPRIGTPASRMVDDISLEVKEDRLHRLNDLINKYSLLNNQKYIDKIVSVLVLGVSDKKADKLMGYSENMKLVNFEGDIKYIGKIVNVRITSVKSWSIDGVIIE